MSFQRVKRDDESGPEYESERMVSFDFDQLHRARELFEVILYYKTQPPLIALEQTVLSQSYGLPLPLNVSPSHDSRL